MLPNLLPHTIKPFDVVGLGEASFDVVGVVSSWPAPDEKHALAAFDATPGGQVATALVACARLDWRARFHGFLGDDAPGRHVEAALMNEGVDVAAIRRRDVSTRAAIVLVDQPSGRRTVLGHRDARLALTGDDVRADVITSGRVLLVDGSDPTASRAAAVLARAAGIRTICDVDRAEPGVEAMLDAIDIIVTSATFPVALTGERSPGAALAALAARFRPAMAVMTLGAEGSLALIDGREVRTTPPDVAVVDTTGAGDAFRGGLIAAWLESTPAASAAGVLRYANAVAALSCTRIGAMAGLPGRATVAGVTGGGGGQSK